MKKPINKFTCTFENPIQEENFQNMEWKRFAPFVKIGIIIMSIIPLLTLISFIKLGFYSNIPVYVLFILISIFTLLMPEKWLKNSMNWLFLLVFGFLWPLDIIYNFNPNYYDVFNWALTPLMGIIIIFKVFPLQFSFALPISIIAFSVTLYFQNHARIQNYEYAYYIIPFIILVFDKWRSDINARIEFNQKETIQGTRKLMHETLKRYFGDALSEKILSEQGTLTGETKWVTVCFTDISSYSTIVEYMSPAVAVEFLNEYFTVMHRIIEKNNGQILNYIGDSIMIVFGAPNNLKNHEKIAVECAIEMRDELKVLNQKWDENELSRYWKNHGIETINARIGIHTGNVIAGNIGSEKMLQYSTIGDVVNVAARLEKTNKKFNTNICMSQEIHTALTKDLIDKSNFVGEITLTGRNAPSKVFSI